MTTCLERGMRQLSITWDARARPRMLMLLRRRRIELSAQTVLYNRVAIGRNPQQIPRQQHRRETGRRRLGGQGWMAGVNKQPIIRSGRSRTRDLRANALRECRVGRARADGGVNWDELVKFGVRHLLQPFIRWLFSFNDDPTLTRRPTYLSRHPWDNSQG